MKRKVAISLLVATLLSGSALASSYHMKKLDDGPGGKLEEGYFYTYDDETWAVSRSANLKVNSKPFDFSYDAKNVLRLGRTYMPFRALGEALGADVGWDAKNLTAYFKKDNNTIKIDIMNGVMYVNDVPKSNELGKPFIMEDRSYIPIRFVIEEMGYRVDWHAEELLVDIITEKEEDKVINNDSNTNNDTVNDTVIEKPDDTYIAKEIITESFRKKKYKILNLTLNNQLIKTNKPILIDDFWPGDPYYTLIPVEEVARIFDQKMTIIDRETVKLEGKMHNLKYNSAIFSARKSYVTYENEYFKSDKGVFLNAPRLIDGTMYINMHTLATYLGENLTAKRDMENGLTNIYVDDVNQYKY
ncbi:MAG: stalk domain-containing protein [Andreesenia angusta]|nr:stalk domain-containing protein [Andreesenia angusta]